MLFNMCPAQVFESSCQDGYASFVAEHSLNNLVDMV